ncbi:Acetyltransferase [Vibrio stylophorae]|uniref:Acetyltransferase n=1 Tax=Vibrio stylophorae TaxID=659351 RepID=A0ABN8DRC5_9VIBR|nr:GNAT family N-acetyltransferase [Vibrio stylophorae]CAH0532330.1 Acetyltransferase [Vibrio stylophorae]
MTGVVLTTPRVIIRPWREEDRQPFAQMSQDPAVMRYFPNHLSLEQSHAMVDKMQQLIEENGWGFWALERQSDGAFMGLAGLHRQNSSFPNGPLVEIGWRLAQEFWHQGYAQEAAQAILTFAFERLKLAEVYAFTALCNAPSRQLMTRLGMKNCESDFDHPKLPVDHPLCRHCLYRISDLQWQQNKGR